MFEKITVSYKGQNLRLVRIKEKTDGKNNSSYDGTWVSEEAYERFKEIDEKKSNPGAYQAEEVFFLKKFPKGAAVVEGFAEAVLGEIIDQCISQKIISENYKDCFSPAHAIELPDKAGLALLQPFAQGYKPIFTIKDPDQKKRDTILEVLLKKLFNKRYEFAIEDCSPSGLSYLFMFPLVFANYSFHSANVFFKDIKIIDKKELLNKVISEKNLRTIKRIYKLLDYGAAFRNFGKTYEADDIFISLDVFTRYFNVHKHYTNYYRHIPNFFESAVGHAAALFTRLKESDELKKQFKSIIRNAVIHAYDLLKRGSGREWLKTRATLFHYVLNADPSEYNFTRGRDHAKSYDNHLRNRFAAKIANIAFYRLYQLSVWTRPEPRVTSIRYIASNNAETLASSHTSPVYDSSAKLQNHDQETKEGQDDISRLISSTTAAARLSLTVSQQVDALYNETLPHTPMRAVSSASFSFNYTNLSTPAMSRHEPNVISQLVDRQLFKEDADCRTPGDSVSHESKSRVTWAKREPLRIINKSQAEIGVQQVPQLIKSYKTIKMYKRDTVARLINNAGALSDDSLNLQLLTTRLQDMLAIAKGKHITDDLLQAIIESLRRKRSLFGGEGNTRSYQQVVTAYKKAVLDILESLPREDRELYFSSNLFDCDDQNHMDLLRELLNTPTGFFASGTTTSAKKFDKMMLPPCARQSIVECFFNISSPRNYQLISPANRHTPIH